VTLPDGQPVAQLRWHLMTTRGAFEILDPSGTVEVGRGLAEGLTRRRFVVYGAAGVPVLQLRLGWFGPIGRSTVTLSDGSVLTTKGSITGRRFAVRDTAGRDVARIVPTTGLLSIRPDSFGFELAVPVLSAVQAIGLVQALRAALKSSRN
jgi:hypothetical protein